MKKLLSSIFLSALAATSAMAGGEKQVDGLDYYLPKTAVRMQVLVEKTAMKPGQLADYSELYFKKPAATTPQTTYRIVGISFTSEGQPDADKKFTVAVDKKHSIFTIDCAPNGVLRAINAKGKTVARPNAFRAAPKAAPLNPRDYMSQDILAAANQPKMAQLVAQEIYDVRDSRNLLSRGEADFMPKDGEQLRLMYEQLNRQERALMQLFQGTTTVDTTEYVVTLVPEKKAQRVMAFRFSKKFGLSTTDDLSGEPYYVDIAEENVTAEPPVVHEMAKKLKDELQLAVCLPGKIRLTLSNNDKKIARYEMWAAQFGKIEMLNGALFGKKLTSKILLDSATGAVTELTTEPLE